MKFEALCMVDEYVWVDRCKVYGGWIVIVTTENPISRSSFFYPDPEHKWDGKSLEQ